MKPSDYVRQGWTQGVSARAEGGIPCEIDSPKAVAWCLGAAICKAIPDVTEQFKACIKLDLTPHISTVEWNDVPGRTQEEVIELLEKAGL